MSERPVEKRTRSIEQLEQIPDAEQESSGNLRWKRGPLLSGTGHARDDAVQDSLSVMGLRVEPGPKGIDGR